MRNILDVCELKRYIRYYFDDYIHDWINEVVEEISDDNDISDICVKSLQF